MRYVKPEARVKIFVWDDIIVCSGLVDKGENEGVGGSQDPDINVDEVPW